MLFVIAMFAGAGVVMVALATPLILRRVPPNGLYGLRIPATFADESVWYEANRRSGFELLVLGIILLSSSVLMLVLDPTERTAALALPAISVLGTLAMLAVGWRRANRMVAQRQNEE